MGIFKKFEVPQELPDLEIVQEGADENQQHSSIEEPENKNIEVQQSFFQEILEKLESNDVRKIEEIHKKEDLLEKMKEYWLKQDASLAAGPGKELKKRLLEKISMMRMLEKEWQETYFSLMEKEERIKKEEATLKDDLAEFIKLYKKHKKSEF